MSDKVAFVGLTAATYVLLFFFALALGAIIYFSAKTLSKWSGLQSNFLKPIFIVASFLIWMSLATLVCLLTVADGSVAKSIAYVAIPGFVALLSSFAFLPFWILRSARHEVN